MKTFFALFIYLVVTTLILFSSNTFDFNREKYIDKKVLDLSVPIDVKIDTDLLNSLKPANEQ